MSVDASSANPAAGIDPSRARIAGAIKQAASTTGTSFEYLLATAKMESNFNPTASASTSSARGLFQFIDQTWLGTVKEAGSQLGYGNYADAITKSSSGSYSVRDPSARSAILKLRDDPAASSAMAGVLTQSNSFKLTGKIGRRPTDGELYMAHFMGVGGAAKLIANAEDNPQASGARLFPNAAAANRSIFYERGGRARSVSEVYSVLTPRYASAANSPATRTAMASVGVTPASKVASQRQLRLSITRPICRAFPTRARSPRWRHHRRQRSPRRRCSSRTGRFSVRCSRPANARSRSLRRCRNCGATARRSPRCRRPRRRRRMSARRSRSICSATATARSAAKPKLSNVAFCRHANVKLAAAYPSLYRLESNGRFRARAVAHRRG